MKVPFVKIKIGESERAHLKEVLDSGWLTTAGKTMEFERGFAEFVGSKYACAVNSCTAALHLGLDSLGLRAGDKVFIPTMTFTATAEVVRYLDADIIPLDIEYGTNLLTPDILKEAIKKNPDVKFLIVVHYSGQAAEMSEILKICEEHGIKVMEDAAHAFPAKRDGEYVGTFSKLTCFSFYANKTITTGEGGMLVTDDEDIYNRVKTMRLHGINRDVWGRFTSKKPSWEYDVVDAGYKYNMPDLAAAIGLGQLEKAEELRSQRQKAVEFYVNRLSEVSEIDLPRVDIGYHEHAWHIFPIVLNDSAKISRNELIERLAEQGIGCSVHYKPIHRLKYYSEKYNLNPAKFPNADKVWKGTLSLPLYAGITEDQLAYVVDCLLEILNN